MQNTTEQDPTGKTASEPGAKLDDGKLRVGLVLGGFSNALELVSKIGTDGAVKYSPNGWKLVPNGYERYHDAMLRHWLALNQGCDRDSWSGDLHLAHLAWNALAMLEIISSLQPAKEDQRNPRGGQIPKGKTCDDCINISKCAELIGNQTKLFDVKTCMYRPARFMDSVAPTYKEAEKP